MHLISLFRISRADGEVIVDDLGELLPQHKSAFFDTFFQALAERKYEKNAVHDELQPYSMAIGIRREETTCVASRNPSPTKKKIKR